MNVAHGGTYFDQQQHSSFFFFGNSGESLISDCFLFDQMPADENLIPELQGQCNFKFETKKGHPTYVKLNFEDLQAVHNKLISDLENYTTNLVTNNPPNLFQKYFTFRDNDYQWLEEFVVDLKTEALPYKVLFRKDYQTHGHTPQFFNKKIVENLMDIFKENLEPYALD